MCMHLHKLCQQGLYHIWRRKNEKCAQTVLSGRGAGGGEQGRQGAGWGSALPSAFAIAFCLVHEFVGASHYVFHRLVVLRVIDGQP